MQDTEFPVRNPRFMRDRRREFNAARKVLEITLKQETNPALVKAIDEHHTEIRNLVEKWREAFPWELPLFDNQFDEKLWIYGVNNLPGEVNVVRNDPLFKAVREHLPLEDFWKRFKDWENLWSELVENCEKVREKLDDLSREAEAWPNVIKLRHDFQKPASHEITQRQFGIDELDTLLFDTRKECLWGYFKYPDGEYSQQYIILEAEHPEDHIDNYKSLINEVLNLEETDRIIKISIELFDILRQIHEELENILIRKVWVTSRCQWCPGQTN